MIKFQMEVIFLVDVMLQSNVQVRFTIIRFLSPTITPMSDHTENLMVLDLEALDSNLDYIKHLAGPEKQLIASIKANAYGHDVRLVAGALQENQVDMLATGNIDDAVSHLPER